MGAFNKRRGRGIGVFLTREDIEKRHSASVSELLRYVPGVTISQRMAGEPQPVHMQRSSNATNQATCTVALYVDGNPYPNGSVGRLPAGIARGDRGVPKRVGNPGRVSNARFDVRVDRAVDPRPRSGAPAPIAGAAQNDGDGAKPGLVRSRIALSLSRPEVL